MSVPRRALLLLAVLAATPAARAGLEPPAPPDPDYASALAAFFKEVDAKVPFFRDKGIEDAWARLQATLLREARRCRDRETFNRIMERAVAGLRDGHAWFTPGEPPPEPPSEELFCGLSLAPIGRSGVVVLGGTRSALQRVPAGSLVLTIEGKNARRVLEQAAREAWKRGGRFSSPQRARFEEFRQPGRRTGPGTIKLQVQTEGRRRRVTLPIESRSRNWVRNYNLPKDLQRAAESVWYARLEGDVGYVWLRRLDETAETGFGKARAALAGVKAWIIDLRGNSGGGYDRSLRDGLADLERPVVALIDAGCFSAGETFARDLAEVADAHLMGRTTAGSSSTKRTFALPDGLGEVRYSVGSRPNGAGKMIEFHGVAPDEEIEPDPAEVAAGENSGILRAREWIARRRR